MKTINSLAGLFLAATLCCLASTWFGSGTQAATLRDFGYDNSIHWINGTPPRGHRPLLVVLIHVVGGADFDQSHSLSYYDTNTFNLFSSQSLNGYFFENSKGRFFWSRAGAGTIGPLELPREQSFAQTAIRAGQNRDLTDLLYHSNLVAQTMIKGSVDLWQFDDDANGVVTRDELCILFIANESGPGAAGVRFPGPVRPPGFLYTVDIGLDAGVQWQSGFDIKAHEMSHLLGAWDLYGNTGGQSTLLTVMGTSSGNPDSLQTFHMDPFHKLQFGWYNANESAIQFLGSGGVTTLHAASTGNADPPLILYDPSRGTSEFFMVEYRTRSWPGGTTYERELPGDGVVIWHVIQDLNHAPPTVTWFEAGPIPAQTLWRMCVKCKGLHFTANNANPTLGPCPAGGQHSRDNSSAYLVVNNNPAAPGQHDWRWCHKCGGLSYRPGESVSSCPAGGTHDGSQSGDYSLMQNDPSAPGLPDWRWCHKCQGIFYGPNQFDGDCPAEPAGLAGKRHDGSQSGSYAMLMEGLVRGVRSLGAPSLRPGGNDVWGSGSTTPYLRFGDGTPTRTRLHVRPFNPTDGSVVVEWWTEEETWVDYNYPGVFPFIEFGTFDFPYNTLGEAASVAPFGGIVSIKSSTGNESVNITKRLRLQAYGGPATIGR